MIATAVFWGSLAVIAYVYAGYPGLLRLLAAIRPREIRRAPHRPSVTVLIAAYNEREPIAETVRNKLASDYPADLLDVIVASDGSDDGTDDVLRELQGDRMRWFRMEARSGKTAALNRAVAMAGGEIVVFADANSIYEPGTIPRLVENFADPTVGYVTGNLVYGVREGSVAGAGSSGYMRYENALRETETLVGSVVGVNGGVDAVRRALYKPMRADQLPDFVLPLAVVQQGFRVVYDRGAVCREPALVTARDEYGMRVRVALRALWALWDMRPLLNPLRFPVYAWQLWSHKVARYGAFLFLMAAWVSNVVLAARHPVYTAFLAAQSACYAAAAAGWFLDRRRVALSRLAFPYYFLLLNLGAAQAFVLFILGRKRAVWTPRKG